MLLYFLFLIRESQPMRFSTQNCFDYEEMWLWTQSSGLEPDKHMADFHANNFRGGLYSTWIR